jgi:hypothetical protein
MAAPLTAIRLVLVGAVGLSAAVIAAAAVAAPMSLHEAFMGGGRLAETPTGPPAARYQTDEGGVFILDRTAGKPLLKFTDDPEIWVLHTAQGPHGDVIYRNDLNEQMLRATGLGGLTVFTMRRPAGSAAAYDGAGQPLHIGPVSPLQLRDDFYQASFRASRFARHEIVFETEKDAEASTSAAYADAAQVTSEAIVDIAALPNGRLLLTRFNDVVITQGSHPNAVLQRGKLIVTIVPKDSVMGRPSSRRIARAVGAP